MCDSLKLEIPGTSEFIVPGSKIKLDRFESTLWLVHHGWFDFAGNRAFCGWFLTNLESGQVKPLLRIDLDDIYLVE